MSNNTNEPTDSSASLVKSFVQKYKDFAAAGLGATELNGEKKKLITETLTKLTTLDDTLVSTETLPKSKLISQLKNLTDVIINIEDNVMDHPIAVAAPVSYVGAPVSFSNPSDSEYSDEEQDQSHAPVNEEDYSDEEPEVPVPDGTYNMVVLTTEGLKETDLEYNKMSHAAKKTLKYCEMCGKFYSNDMMIGNEGENCWHCFYWMNYDLACRHFSDGVYGLSIAEYVLKCKDDHDISTCTRRSDHGGCFICEFLMGFPIIDIKDAFLLYETNETTYRVESDDDHDVDYDNDEDLVIDL